MMCLGLFESFVERILILDRCNYNQELCTFINEKKVCKICKYVKKKKTEINCMPFD